MKKPKKVRKEYVLCVACGNPIHIDEWAGMTKKGMYHNNILCLIALIKETEGD